MFDKDRFVQACIHALTESSSQLAIKKVVEQAVAEPSHVERALGPIAQGGIQTLYHASDLTILHFVWAP